MELFTLPPLRILQYVLRYNPAHSRITPKSHPKRIVRHASYLPSWQVMLSVLRCCKNSFQKNRDVFWSVGKPQYKEANDIIPNAPSTILKKTGVDRIQHQKKRIGSINLLPVSHPQRFSFLDSSGPLLIG